MIVDEYVNENGHVTHLWWVHPKIMLGGFVMGPFGWEHLRDKHGIRSVLNVCSDQSDEGKGIPLLAECRVNDDGTGFPRDLVRHAVSFAKLTIGHGPIYVHCALGNSRSPAFAYAIMRWVFGMTSNEALAAIRAGKPGATAYGTHSVQASYLESVERALRV